MNQANEQPIGALAPPSVNVTSSSMTQLSQPISIQLQNTWSLQYEKFNSKLAKQLGVTQLVVGGVALLLNVVGLVLHAVLFEGRDPWCCISGQQYKVASGIWGAMFIGLSGGFSLRAAKLKTKCNIMTTMVTSLLSLVVAAFIAGMACWSIATDVRRIKEARREHDPYYNDSAVSPLEACSGLAVSVMFLAAGIALVVTCCRTVVICARVIRCGSQYGSISNCGDSLMQVVDSEGQPIPGARIIQVSGSSDTQQLLATPTSVLDPNTTRWSCIISCVRNRGNETDLSKPPPY